MRPTRLALAAALLCLSMSTHAQSETMRYQGKHSAAEYPNAIGRYACAFVRIADAAWEAYRDLYGLPLAEPIQIHVTLAPDKGASYARLWTDGHQDMFLVVGSEAPLKAPMTGGVHNVYGMCHELGHMAVYRRMRSTGGMPEGIGEGWAHYFGSVITTRVYETLGQSVYPDAHNFSVTSGMPRLLAQFARSEQSGKWDADTRAAKILYDVEHKYGRKTFAEVLNKALSTRPSGGELVGAFADALTSVTKDAQAAAIIPDEFRTSKVKIEAADADITRKGLYRGLRTDWEGGLLKLSYGDGAKDGQRSIGGSGHAVIFCRPEGRWQLAGVEFHGCRYGTPTPPADDFSVYLCDEKFRVVREVRAPYSRFPTTGEWKWERIEIPAVDAPAYFYVVICFEPTASRGIYMAIDSHVERSHSRMAYPGSHVMDMRNKSDWMIRCLLKPADPATQQKAKDLAAKLQSEVDKAG